ncbi:MAG: hypothetical protein ACOYYU_04785 [Chloroflexota bacterium]
MQMKSDHKDILVPHMSIVPQVIDRGELGNDPSAASHEVDDRCHQLGGLNYAMITAEQDDEEHPSRTAAL